MKYLHLKSGHDPADRLKLKGEGDNPAVINRSTGLPPSAHANGRRRCSRSTGKCYPNPPRNALIWFGYPEEPRGPQRIVGQQGSRCISDLIVRGHSGNTFEVWKLVGKLAMESPTAFFKKKTIIQIRQRQPHYPHFPLKVKNLYRLWNGVETCQ